MRLVVTGAAGFIGTNFVRHALARSADAVSRLVAVDLLTYAGNYANLADLQADPRFRFVRADIADRDAMATLVEEEAIDTLVNCAAETHVDRSIADHSPFVTTNVEGTLVLLEAARQRTGFRRFLQVSTDEVYGSISAGRATEDWPTRPSSPYAASKAAADAFVQAYATTYGLPAIITRCSNNYGPYQFPEKLIPLFVTNGLDGEALPLYGDGLNVRDWTDVILRLLDRLASLVRYVDDRPGHDRRYALDATRLRRLGWAPRRRFEEGLADTVAWYREQRAWWEAIKSGAYRDYYERMYGGRLRDSSAAPRS